MTTPIDHVAQAIERLPPRLRAGNYAKVIAALARPLQTFEQALDDFSRGYSLLTSKTTLPMLRWIAARFGLVLPPGYDKEAYRVFVAAQAAAVLSSGTWPQVYNVANLLRPPDVPPASLAWVDRVPPDAVSIGIPGFPPAWASVGKQIIRQALRAQDDFSLAVLPADFFTFDKGPGFDVGKLAYFL